MMEHLGTNPYIEVRRTNLSDEDMINCPNIKAVQINREKTRKNSDGETISFNEWDTIGQVSKSYNLVKNATIKEYAEEVVPNDFTLDRTWFDGRRFMLSYISDTIEGEVIGDPIAMGIQFWNSYDGSRRFGFNIMLYNLVCLNGMTSKTLFDTYNFKHNNESNIDKFKEELGRVGESIIESKANKVPDMLKGLNALTGIDMTMDNFSEFRKEYLPYMPKNNFCSILDEFIETRQQKGNSAWTLLNAGTKTLWKPESKKSVTNQDYVHNTTWCDAMLMFAVEKGNTLIPSISKDVW